MTEGLSVAREWQAVGPEGLKCPACGGELETGFLICEALTDGPKWATKPSKLGIGGDELLKPNKFGILNIESGRCLKCRTIAFRF